MRQFSLAASLLLLVALSVQVNADIPPQPKPDPKPKPKDEVKLPWSAEDARKGWGKGVSFLFDVEHEGGKGWMRWEAEEITEKGFKSTEIVFEGDKASKRRKPRETEWEKHLSGLQRELSGAEKSKGEVKVPYGTIECEIYTLTKEEATQKIALSAKVPGMVVLMEMEATRGGKRDYEKWELRSIDLPVCEAPWTDDKIAENFKAGTKTAYAGKSSDGDVKVEYVISASDIKGMTSASTETYGDKPPVKGEPATATWDGYLRYFVPPRFDTKTSEEKLKTPAGEYDCVVFTHEREAEGVKLMQKVWLAKNEPGLLVRCDVEQEMGGKKIFYNMELTELVKGK
jgi:hypothetical protein